MHISIYGWDIATSGLEKQTSTMLEFYFRFRSRPFSSNLHFILNQPAEFRPNRSTHCGNMTSYSFLKMAASTAKYYFRFCWCHCLQKVKVYQQTKFCRHISIDGSDITTSVLEKNKRPPYWKSTFGFDFNHFPEICALFCIRLPNFVKSKQPLRKYDAISIS